MAVIGIVGSEAAKFTAATERLARRKIHHLIKHADLVVSGGCHLGGIDIWAVEEARKLGIAIHEYLPTSQCWNAYKARNIQIAKASDVVYCLTVAKLPVSYKGMRFKLCYHCKTADHVKSGGCWTMHYARKLGKALSRTILIGGHYEYLG